MNRISKLFKIKSEKVIPFITAGFPAKKYTVDMVLAAEKSGASMVEIGMPYSDPLADGPIVQEASQISISNGVTISWILEVVLKIRASSQIPIALMGYINPILKYGLEKFIKKCHNVGVDGLILPDMPLEESSDYVKLCYSHNIVPIMLVSPNTPGDRIKEISMLSKELIYCVAILGITGNNFEAENNFNNYMERVKRYSVCPYIVGFGVKNRNDVVNINSVADGAVIGSAIISKIMKSDNPVSVVSEYLMSIIR